MAPRKPDSTRTDDPAEELRLEPNGTVTAVLEGKRVTLRRPKLGEFRKLRELLHDSQDRLYAMAEAVKEAGSALEAEADAAESVEAVTALREVRRLDREYTTANEDDTVAWMRATFDMLADSPLPADDDLPLWAADGTTVAALITHWRSVPLDRGGN